LGNHGVRKVDARDRRAVAGEVMAPSSDATTQIEHTRSGRLAQPGVQAAKLDPIDVAVVEDGHSVRADSGETVVATRELTRPRLPVADIRGGLKRMPVRSGRGRHVVSTVAC